MIFLRISSRDSIKKSSRNFLVDFFFQNIFYVIYSENLFCDFFRNSFGSSFKSSFGTVRKYSTDFLGISSNISSEIPSAFSPTIHPDYSFFYLRIARNLFMNSMHFFFQKYLQGLFWKTWHKFI